MAEPTNKIQIFSEYVDLASPKIKQSFKKNEKSVQGFAGEVDKMRKSMLRAASVSRKEMKESLDRVSSALKTTASRTKKAKKEMTAFRIITKGLRREVGKIRNLFLLWFFVFNPIIKKFKQLTGAMSRQEDAVHRLNVALQGQSVFTEHVSEKLREQAAAFQKVTRYGDEAILEVMQKLSSLGKVLPSQLKRVTQATLDLAASQRMELATATDLVAKAATGYTGTLSRYGILIEQSIPKTEKLNAVLEAIRKKGWGGAAQRDIETYSGQVAQLGNNFSDVQEKLGKFLVDLLHLQDAVIPFWSEFLDKANEWLKSKQEPTFEQSLLRQIKIFDDMIERQQEIVNTSRIMASISIFGPDTGVLEKHLAILEGIIKRKGAIIKLIVIHKEKQKELADLADLEADRLERIEILRRAQAEKDEQVSKIKLQMEKKLAMASLQAWEDLFFNAMTGKFRELEDVVIQFGNTVLKTMIRLGVQRAFVSAGLGSVIGIAAHSGGAIRSGMSASYGAGAARKNYHRGGEVDATLLDGEFVLNRRATKNAGVDNLNKLNRGQNMGGTTINNFYDINAIDEKSFRDKLSQNDDIYTSAVNNDLPANKEIRRTIQRFT